MTVKQRLKKWIKIHGVDVEARCRYVSGSYYRFQQPQWEVCTDRFLVGPHTTLEECLEQLTELYKK